MFRHFLHLSMQEMEELTAIEYLENTVYCSYILTLMKPPSMDKKKKGGEKMVADFGLSDAELYDPETRKKRPRQRACEFNVKPPE